MKVRIIKSSIDGTLSRYYKYYPQYKFLFFFWTNFYSESDKKKFVYFYSYEDAINFLKEEKKKEYVRYEPKVVEVWSGEI
jgi:hypothetical protein